MNNELEYKLKDISEKMDTFPASRISLLKDIEKWLNDRIDRHQLEHRYKRWINSLFFHCRNDISFITILKKRYPSVKCSLCYVFYCIWNCTRQLKQLIL